MSQALAVIEHQLQPLRPMFDQLLRPTGVPAERIIRSVLISCERTPKLLECTAVSVIQAATTGAVLGLEADGHTGQGFLVPFRQKGVQKAQWITGYKGYSTLAARVGLTVNGEVVREGDFIDFELGSSGYVKHKPMVGGGTNRRIIGAWATASAPSRDPIIVWLDIDDILAIKARSQAAKRDGGDDAFSPWNEPVVGFPAMAGKSAKRRLARALPLSVYLSGLLLHNHAIEAARIDEAHEEQGHHAYLHPEKGIVIDGEAAPPASQSKGLPVEALERPHFVIKRNRDETRCATIEEWRGRMVTAIQSIGEIANVRRFRELNEPVLQEYRDRHREHVDAVEAAFSTRLRAAQQNRPGDGHHQSEQKGVPDSTHTSSSSRSPGVIAEIEPVKIRGGFDWKGYAERVLSEFRALPPTDRQPFRNAQARYLKLLRQADKEASTDLAMAMANVDRGDLA